MTAVRYLRIAESELLDAAEYYDAQAAGLGRRLVEDVETTVARIIEQPTLGQVVQGNLRQRLLIHFPYRLIYSYLNNEITVLAVAHFKRLPSYWIKRNERLR